MKEAAATGVAAALGGRSLLRGARLAAVATAIAAVALAATRPESQTLDQPLQQARPALVFAAAIARRVAARFAARVAARLAALVAANAAAMLAAARLAARGRAARRAARHAMAAPNRHFIAALAANLAGHAARYHLGHAARYLHVNRARDHLAHAVRHLLAHRVAFHRRHRRRNHALHGLGHHAAHRVRYLLAAILVNRSPHRVGHLLAVVLFHHVAGRGHPGLLVMAAFDEVRAWIFTIMRAAVVIDEAAHRLAVDRVGHGLTADVGFHAGHGVRDLLHAGLVAHAGVGHGHLLDDGAGDLLAHRVGHGLANTFLDVGRARNLLANAALVAHPAALHFRRALDFAAVPMATLVDGLAGARVEAALIAVTLPDSLALARHAVLLGHPLAAFPLHGLHGAAGLAYFAYALLVAGLDARLAHRAANFLIAGLAHRTAGRAAHVLPARLAHRRAHRMAALAAVRLAQDLARLHAALVAMLLVNRTAHRVRARTVARLRAVLANLVMAFTPAGLIARFVAGLADFLHAAVRHRTLAGFLHGPVARLIARTACRPALVPANGPGHRFQTRLMDGPIGRVPALLEHCVIDQAVACRALCLALGITALSLAHGLTTPAVAGCTAIRRFGALGGGDKHHPGYQQRRYQAIPHVLASSTVGSSQSRHPSVSDPPR